MRGQGPLEPIGAGSPSRFLAFPERWTWIYAFGGGMCVDHQGSFII